MTAIDTNILIYAHRKDAPKHDAARNCLRILAESRETWAIPWPCVHEFLAVVTNRRAVLNCPESIVDAGRDRRDSRLAWVTLSHPDLTLIGETTAHWLYLKQILTASNVTGPVTHDARIAAICRQHGVTRFLTADRDFSRFPDLHAVNPLTV